MIILLCPVCPVFLPILPLVRYLLLTCGIILFLLLFCVSCAGVSFPVTCCITFLGCLVIIYVPGLILFRGRSDASALSLWQRGETGFPIIDAGMRELWQTGYMHNRVRMLVGSFLVKNLLLHWHHGASWFWDTLLDADLANNSAGWQWVSGSGIDAAPYFRIFNPVLQGEKFDSDGAYVAEVCS